MMLSAYKEKTGTNLSELMMKFIGQEEISLMTVLNYCRGKRIELEGNYMVGEGSFSC